MDAADIARHRARLTALRADLIALSKGAAEDRKPVGLDQQSVGRLSRQDSLQVQAMARAAEARRAGEVRRIDAAIARLDAGEYGYCVECGEEIEHRRLGVDPAAPRCSACAS
ncbi:molecular chaperone DnaK [Marinicauda pacifica]|jgi:DnaK suppressor protein|uniref:TraR/DksA family transcriptional regulator n=1 Tax=Marinicauda pacifica TaxID=1133559 RepID=A0A4S2H8N9_9PROT|nr:TraR/DksA C4-type zinc finger protein [Marinicauda pacifica]TGY92204.1 TraR/DksA family transcriptional regulator [Marinicauda pacifica]GGE46878.1 molecular chaperone DnaK [Marinicauda pacifica]